MSVLKATSAQAEAICRREGGVLAVARDSEANAHLAELLRARAALDADAAFLWLGGRASDVLSYARWARDQPDRDGDCVEMWTTGEWNDTPCGSAKVYACDVPSPPAELTFECSPGVVSRLRDAGRIAGGAARPRCQLRIFGDDGQRPSGAKVDFPGCQRHCASLGSAGAVAEPRSAAQRLLIARALRQSGDDSAWVGLQPSGGGGWRWVGSDDMLAEDDAGWASGQPDGADGCVELWWDATWNDRACAGDFWANKVCACELPLGDGN